MDYKDKIITIEEVLAKVKSNDVIVTGMSANEPLAFLEKLPTIADRVENVTITNCLPVYDGEYLRDEKCIKAFNIESWFFTGVMRKAFKNGNVSHIPGHLHLYAKKRREQVRTNLFICQASMPDENGNVSLGMSNVYETAFLDYSDMIVLEINKKMPFTDGDHIINVKDVDYLVEVDYDLLELPDAPSSKEDELIGKHIADLINDGDCIQVGIGGIPNAVCNCLMDKKHLGIHTEMMTTGLMRLMKNGAVDNSMKQVDVGKSVCAFILGTKELYDFVKNNKDMYIMNAFQANNPDYIKNNDNQVSINTCIEIDLTGQCCSETIGTRQFSGSGGQCDTAVGAQNSKNGRSFISLHSTTVLTDKKTGEKKRISKIVPTLKPGATVTLGRCDVDYVVTEFGVACLRGLSIDKRAQALIAIAHPDFRDELYKQAVECGYITEKSNKNKNIDRSVSQVKNVYLLGICRTAVGSFGGTLKDVKAADLGSLVIKESLNRAGVKPEQVDEVFMGNVLQAAQGQNVARQCSLKAGIPIDTPATTLNKVCGSGLHAVTLAYRTILAGEGECIVAGGTESMSNAPFAVNGTRFGHKMGNNPMIDVMINDGLWDAFNNYHMGITAENIAEKYNITRQMQDEFAVRSQERAAKAIEEGKFKSEIVPVEIPQRKGEPIIFDTDEYVKPGTALEKIAKLKPSFKKDGTVTAANASGLNDGAAAVIVASEEFVKKHNLKPMAKIVATGSKGVDPSVMGLGPIPSVKAALEKANLKVEDIDLIEANEAFASQAIEVCKELDFPAEKTNVNGGAIAIGHPIGASGARILTTLMYEMEKRESKYGIATLCIGGGMGEAVIIERV